MKVRIMDLVKVKVEYKSFIYLIVLVSTLTAFAIIPTVPATVPAYLLTIILLCIFFASPIKSELQKKTAWEFFLFVFLFLGITLMSQIASLLFPVSVPKTIVLIDASDYTTLILRSSLITQSAYLICNVFLYLMIKNYGDERLIKFILWTFRLLIIYGLYELIFYMVFNTSGDFISNRVYGNQEDGVIGGSFQLQSIGAISWLRIKGFTGEPSMFSFTTLPYFALLIGMKKKWEAALCLCCLILTFSTTAFLGLFIYGIYLMFFSSNRKLRYSIMLIIGSLIILVLFLYTTNDIFSELINQIFLDKFSGQTVSGDERSSFFLATFNFWRTSDILHFLFGFGFGFARSTDFCSTLLFNTGLFGFLAFTAFVCTHLFIPVKNKILKENYRAAVIMLFVVMMVSVPEFAYCSFWVILASGYIIKNYNLTDSANVIYR
ncbi:hypothetical protein J3L18_08165 [Mucilaginibacter gossypii]|uniref:hypothetical protein n=1 Tax=Mucilaginibacter gossypii TaxID=551996 RepID=UPI001AA0CE4C|nr:hypothetical protein [Mucilaginibacter gossypii]QTE39017.1 hypothetical protein J3L18_08165 [Mucilaginibacter gossypii]